MDSLAGKGQGNIIRDGKVITAVKYEIKRINSDPSKHDSYIGQFSILGQYDGFSNEVTGLVLEIDDGRIINIYLKSFYPKAINPIYIFGLSPGN